MNNKKIFLRAAKEIRKELIKIAGKYSANKHLELRTKIDTLLIMYDKACELISKHDCKKELKNLQKKLKLKEADNHKNQILIAEVRKQAAYGDNKTWYRDLFVSYDRDKLKKEIEKHYKVKLVKDESDDWPYFTDGGFKYKAKNDTWVIETDAYLYKII